MKILCIEDGSIDVDALENGELREGKVLVYRQGSKPPFVLEINDEYNYQKFWNLLKSQITTAMANMSGNGKHYYEDFLKTMQLIEKQEIKELE